MNYRLLVTIISAALICASAAGCEKSKSSSVITKNSEAAEQMTTMLETTESETEEKNIKETVAIQKENVQTTTAAVTEAATTITTTSASPHEQAEKAKHGYSSAYEAAKAYYNAYLTNNYELIYNMFCEPELNAYNAYFDSLELTETKADDIFTKDTVENAVKASMENVKNLRADNQDSDNDKWSVTLKEEDIVVSQVEDIGLFNETLGTSFTSGADCGYVYYQNETNQKAFVGNGCAFVEYNGKWYLSYTSLIQSELINYMEIFE